MDKQEKFVDNGVNEELLDAIHKAGESVKAYADTHRRYVKENISLDSNHICVLYVVHVIIGYADVLTKESVKMTER